MTDTFFEKFTRCTKVCGLFIIIIVVVVVVVVVGLHFWVLIG